MLLKCSLSHSTQWEPQGLGGPDWSNQIKVFSSPPPPPPPAGGWGGGGKQEAPQPLGLGSQPCQLHTHPWTGLHHRSLGGPTGISDMARPR